MVINPICWRRDPDPQWRYVWRPELATDPSLFRYDTSKLEDDVGKLN